MGNNPKLEHKKPPPLPSIGQSLDDKRFMNPFQKPARLHERSLPGSVHSSQQNLSAMYPSPSQPSPSGPVTYNTVPSVSSPSKTTQSSRSSFGVEPVVSSGMQSISSSMSSHGRSAGLGIRSGSGRGSPHKQKSFLAGFLHQSSSKSLSETSGSFSPGIRDGSSNSLFNASAAKKRMSPLQKIRNDLAIEGTC